MSAKKRKSIEKKVPKINNWEDVQRNVEDFRKQPLSKISLSDCYKNAEDGHYLILLDNFENPSIPFIVTDKDLIAFLDDTLIVEGL